MVQVNAQLAVVVALVAEGVVDVDLVAGLRVGEGVLAHRLPGRGANQASWYEYSRRPPQGLMRTAGPDEGIFIVIRTRIHYIGYSRISDINYN